MKIGVVRCDLYFGVCRGSATANHAGYLQDNSGDTRMNFTGQHRTFVKQIPHKKTEPYVGLIVSANKINILKWVIKMVVLKQVITQ